MAGMEWFAKQMASNRDREHLRERVVRLTSQRSISGVGVKMGKMASLPPQMGNVVGIW